MRFGRGENPGAPLSASDGPSDREVVERVLAGQTEAYSILVRRYQERLYWVAWQLLGNHEDARDVTQETLLRAYGKLGGFDRSRRFFTWTYRIVTNLAIDRLRHRSRTAAGSVPEEIADPGEGPVAKALGQELRREVREVLGTLPPRYQAILVLRDAQGLSGKAISDLTGVAHATVRWRIHRARKLFRAAWEARISRQEGRTR